jgi:hypothetical protein
MMGTDYILSGTCYHGHIITNEVLVGAFVEFEEPLLAASFLRVSPCVRMEQPVYRWKDFLEILCGGRGVTKSVDKIQI